MARSAGRARPGSVRHGYPAQEAQRRARLGLAATRGLLLDLLLTGDRDGVDAASELMSQLLGGID